MASPTMLSPLPAAANHHSNAALQSALAAVTQAVSLHQSLPGANSRATLHEARSAAVDLIARLPRSQAHSHLTDAVAAAAENLLGEPVANLPAEPEAVAAARKLATQGWAGLLATIFLAPAWQIDGLPPLTDTPTWLWPVYSRHLFTSPPYFNTEDQISIWISHYIRHLETVVRLLETNRGSSSIRAVAECVRAAAVVAPLVGELSLTRRRQELTGRLLTLLRAPTTSPLPSTPPQPLGGRSLQVGIVLDHMTGGPGIFDSDHLYSLLDPERFGVRFYVHTWEDDTHFIPPPHIECLPDSMEDRAGFLRNAGLDVLLFAGDLSRPCGPSAELALHRLASCQAVTARSPITTGLPEIDLFLAGAGVLAPQPVAHTERLGLLPTTALAFSCPAENATLETGLTRAALGLPDDALLLVTTATLAETNPALRAQWIRLLQHEPRARLLLVPLHSETTQPAALELLNAGFHHSLKTAGLAENRLIVVTRPDTSAQDILALFRLGDLYLDGSLPDDPEALPLALSVGLPAVVMEDAAAAGWRNALPATLGPGVSVARDAEHYGEIVREALANPALLQTRREQLLQTLPRRPLPFDLLAYADGLGALLEAACAEIEREGRAAFRRKPTPLQLPAPADGTLEAVRAAFSEDRPWDAAPLTRSLLASSPADASIRQLHGRAILALGQPRRAVTYLMAAMEQREADATVWHDLALALHADGRVPDALQALEACVRLDPSQLEPWLLLADWAGAVGHDELVRDITAVVRELAPADPRVTRLVAMLAA